MKLKFHGKYLPLYIIAFFGVLLFFMGIANHYFFRTVTYDYGNYNFAFWDYSHFRISPMPTYPGNFLQDHFSFTLMYFIPVFWLLNWLTGTYTLIIIQYVLILVAAWFTYKFVMLKTDNHWLGVGVLVYYFILLGRYTTFSCDVNLAVISSCFIPVFLYFFEKEKYLVSSVLLILSLFSRENIPLWFIFIFIVLIFQHRKEKKAVLFSLIGIAVSILYFILLFKIFIPAIETEEKQFTLFNYSALGSNPGEALKFIIQNPMESIKLFFINHLDNPAFNRVKAEFYIVYLISGGIILLLRPQFFIWFILIVAQKVLNDSYIRWGISTYYSIEVVTMLPLSVFWTLTSLKSKKLQNILSFIICIATLSMTIYKLDRKNVEIPWTLNPSKEKIYYKGFWKASFDIKKVNKLLRQIPANAKVSASDHLLSHLAQRQHIYLFPSVRDAEYIVFSVFDDYFMISHEENEKNRNMYLYDSGWKIVAQEFPVFLLQSKQSIPGVEKINANKLVLSSDTLFCNFETIDHITNQTLFNNDKVAESASKLTTERSFSKNHSIKLSAKDPYSSPFVFDDIEKMRYMHISIWSLGEENKSHIVAEGSNNFYFSSSKVESNDETGWVKLALSFWIPQNLRVDDLKIYLYNSGDQSVYFDDLKIINYYEKTE